MYLIFSLTNQHSMYSTSAPGCWGENMFANFSKFAASIRKCRLTRTRNTGYFMGGGALSATWVITWRLQPRFRRQRGRINFYPRCQRHCARKDPSLLKKKRFVVKKCLTLFLDSYLRKALSNSVVAIVNILHNTYTVKIFFYTAWDLKELLDAMRQKAVWCSTCQWCSDVGDLRYMRFFCTERERGPCLHSSPLTHSL